MKLNAIVVPFDSGFANRRMGAGPTALVESGALDGARAKVADVSVATYEDATFRAEVQSALAIDRWVAAQVRASLDAGAMPLVLSGNCITSVGTCAGIHAHAGRAPAVCWFDAHADFNTPETTASGFLDGMALGMLTGRCWTQLAATIPGFEPVPESRVALFGARHLDPAEETALRTSGVRWLRSVDDAAAVATALRALRDTSDHVYLHV